MLFVIKSKQKNGFPFTKIVLISSKTLLQERLKGYKVGADDFITKPFNAEELLAKIRVFMQLYKTEKRLQKLNLYLEKEVQDRVQELMQSKKMAFIGMHSAQIISQSQLSPYCYSKLCLYD